MSQLEALIFDMDGVLIDSEPLHLRATNEVLGQEGASLTAEENRIYLGTSEALYWAALIERFDIRRDKAELMAEKSRRLKAIFQEDLPVAAGLVETLREAEALGLELAVASGSDRALVSHVVERAGLSRWLKVLAGGDEVARPKPAPDVYLLAAERLGVSPNRCLAFEDSPQGATSATAAQMAVIRVITETTRSLEFPPTTGVIDSFVGFDVDLIKSNRCTFEGPEA